MIKVALEAPWETFVKEVRALFENDGDIAVSDIYEPEDGSADYGITSAKDLNINCDNNSPDPCLEIQSGKYQFGINQIRVVTPNHIVVLSPAYNALTATPCASCNGHTIWS